MIYLYKLYLIIYNIYQTTFKFKDHITHHNYTYYSDDIYYNYYNILHLYNMTGAAKQSIAYNFKVDHIRIYF